MFERWMKAKKAARQTKRTTNSIYKIPVVVHVIHESGLAIGEEHNLSSERIKELIQNLNDDFRKRIGTRGYNQHPAGADTQIEFQLAQVSPEGTPTDGIIRIDESTVTLPGDDDGGPMDWLVHYGYWNPEQYLNLWFYPMPHAILGMAQFPEATLPGIDPPDEPIIADGVFINSVPFEQGSTSDYNLGRTITHEVGHYLGLLHIWGNGSGCSKDDFCEDTPPVSGFNGGCPTVSPTACNGEPAMIENYMDYSNDACMNIFTLDQMFRMRTVLDNSPRRKTLLNSPGLVRRSLTTAELQVYPNPATDQVSLSFGQNLLGKQVRIKMYTVQGLLLKDFTVTTTAQVSLPLPAVVAHVVLVRIEGEGINIVKKVLVKL